MRLLRCPNGTQLCSSSRILPGSTEEGRVRLESGGGRGVGVAVGGRAGGSGCGARVRPSNWRVEGDLRLQQERQDKAGE